MDRKLKLKRGWFGDTVSYVYLTILAIIAMFPMVWILLTSVKGKGEMMGDPTAFLPKSLTLDNYRTVIQQLGFGGNVVNSIIVAMSTTLIAILISALGAYGVVRFFPKFGKLMTRVLITTYMFPPILLAVPYSIIMGKVNLMNSRVGLVIVYLSFSVPYAIWLLVGFFQTVPLEIEEAARVDGANKLQVFGKVVLPIVAPGLVAVAIYTFINAWNEFLYSLILMNSSDKMTVAVALKSLEGQEVMDWGVMMAASAMVVIPSVIFFMLIQKKIAGGLASGSIK
ncbi:MAG: carbohydrate ABC transporter permease [Flavonifractor sp.]|nr:carbohydrate ABC transporter permease [Flavonifractor sp.]MCI9424482.1 carbohydrate ABC transporter permease [Flavonifractor sp.]MCI9473705.1 carbohydrate ABC transporter permease [Flavonifractor sp.]